MFSVTRRELTTMEIYIWMRSFHHYAYVFTVMPPRAQFPACLVNFWQFLTVVNAKIEDRGSVSFADGNFSGSGYSVSSCKNPRCKTYPRSSLYTFFDSTITSKKYNGFNPLKSIINCKCTNLHYVKSVRIRSYSGPHFPAFGLNTERYTVFLRIQSECGKLWIRITPNKGTF